MCGSLFNRPVLHSVCNHRCGVRVKGTPILNGALQRLVGFFRKTLAHYAVVKYIACKNFTYAHNSNLFSGKTKATGAKIRELSPVATPLPLNIAFSIKIKKTAGQQLKPPAPLPFHCAYYTSPLFRCQEFFSLNYFFRYLVSLT